MNQDALQQFVQLFTLNDVAATQRVSERLQLVLQTPQAYYEQYAEELAERGIVDGLQEEASGSLVGGSVQNLPATSGQLPIQELRDIALIDTLSLEDLAWENDWKETASEMAEGLNEILTRQQRGYSLPTDTLAGGRQQGPEALDSLQDALETKSLALVLFNLNGDAYPLSLVADAQAEETRRLAKELGFTLTVY